MAVAVASRLLEVDEALVDRSVLCVVLGFGIEKWG